MAILHLDTLPMCDKNREYNLLLTTVEEDDYEF